MKVKLRNPIPKPVPNPIIKKGLSFLVFFLFNYFFQNWFRTKKHILKIQQINIKKFKTKIKKIIINNLNLNSESNNSTVKYFYLFFIFCQFLNK